MVVSNVNAIDVWRAAMGKTRSVVSTNHIEGSRAYCVLEQETVPLLLNNEAILTY